MDMVTLGPDSQVSDADRRSARLNFSKSPLFLILGLGWQLGNEKTVPRTICTCHRPEFKLRVVRLVGDEAFSPHHNARILIELKGRQSPKLRIAAANRIVSAIEGLFAHVHHSWWDFQPYQFPKGLLRGAELNARLLNELDALVGRTFGPEGFMSRLVSGVMISDPHMASIFYLLPFVLGNEELFNACTFFRSCCSEYVLMDGVVNEVRRQPKQEPENESQRLSMENIVLQSFRTIEALVGEPGDERRFRTRLKAYGLDYDERVGFGLRRRNRLGERIRWLQEARDSAAAHGRRRRRHPFTLYEAMEAQHLADAVLDRALWFTAESLGRKGDVTEIGFLLGEMLHASLNWVTDQKRFRGKSAVDLAQEPGGLGRVFRSASLGRRSFEVLE
jgi:hypothetical protein